MFEEFRAAVTPSNCPPFRPELAFPSLTDGMIERLSAYGEEETSAASTILFDLGECQVDMFVVLEGSIEVFARRENSEPEGLYVLTERQFSGELDLFTGQRTLIGARPETDSRLLRVSRDGLRRLMRAEGDIANLIMQAAIWRRIGMIADAVGGVVLAGQVDDAQTVQLRRFLIRNGYPHKLLTADISQATVRESNPTSSGDSLPTVFLTDGRVLRQPSISALADELGITEQPDVNTVYDVTVVGAGPSGLAAAVYAASEGLSTFVVEGNAPGGQAGTSSKIENYLGFPTGISGQRLAHRAHVQALKFGVRIGVPRKAIAIARTDGVHELTLEDGCIVRSRAIVIATGAQYRKLSVENFEKFENQGLYYAATAMEGLLCGGNEIVVVGGGNSAGQAAVFLSSLAAHVHLLVRTDSLVSTMSQYLISRIESSSRITLHAETEIVRLDGESKLEFVTWTNARNGSKTTRRIAGVFVMIGAEPNTGWLYGTLRLDRKGFIVTGGREAFESTPYATNVPGIYAVGDVRSESIKRVASAVGEGSVVISDIHRYLIASRDIVSAEPSSTLVASQLAGTAASTAYSVGMGSGT
jgi:thioredoxin reductase (NADPH)